MTVVALWSPHDVLLGVAAPLGAAAAADTALVVDLDPDGPNYGGAFSLADLVADGPTRSQLEPSRRGSAVLRNGGIDPTEATEIVAALARSWPNLVLRCPPSVEEMAAVTSLVPLLPNNAPPSTGGRVVYQRTPLSGTLHAHGMVLPVPKVKTLRALLAGSMPPRRDRWVGALSTVWEG